MVPDKQLDNDKTGNPAADDSELQTGRREASKPRATEDCGQGHCERCEGLGISHRPHAYGLACSQVSIYFC